MKKNREDVQFVAGVVNEICGILSENQAGELVWIMVEADTAGKDPVIEDQTVLLSWSCIKYLLERNSVALSDLVNELFKEVSFND